MFQNSLFLFVFAALTCFGYPQESPEESDLVIYGGTSAGIAAAVQAKRMGKSVVVIEPTQRVGGLTTGGLGQTDIGNKQVIGGISREFYQAVREWYRDPENWEFQEPGEYKGRGQSKTDEGEETMWTFEPSAALAIYHRWIEENDIPVVYGERIDRSGEGTTRNDGSGWLVAAPGSVAKGVEMEDGRITALVMESGKRFRGRYFLDCTYEGDLVACAGVSFTVGREANATYEETYNGVQTENAVSHQLLPGLDPYLVAGDRESGLLPGIDPEGPGTEGGADRRVQAYCFRMCLTDHPENRIPFEKPIDYDETLYELLFRNCEAGFEEMPWINSGMPNRKTDTNNRTGFSTDFIGQNYDYPEASYTEREVIVRNHRSYQKGLMWTLANHPRVTENIRKEVSRWGTCKDEFAAADGWQEQLYIREARRMISDLVMTQNHCQGRETVEDPVGMAAYTMDSHNVQRYVNQDGHARNEGDVQKGGFPPYPISYRSILPREEECANLAVPVCLSASHIAFGSIRMEPVFMILGQSAATAAAQAIDSGNSALQDVEYGKLSERLLADDQILEHTYELPVDSFEGHVIDDMSAETTGDWKRSTVVGGIHFGYLHDQDKRDGKSRAVYRWKDLEPGIYEAQVSYPPNANRATNVPVEIAGIGTPLNIIINQKEKPPIEDLFLSVGTVETNGTVTITISNKDTDGYVVIDAVRLIEKN